jgi:hypothetical protein
MPAGPTILSPSSDKFAVYGSPGHGQKEKEQSMSDIYFTAKENFAGVI